MRTSILLLVLLTSTSFAWAQRQGWRRTMANADQVDNNIPKPTVSELQLGQAESQKKPDSAQPPLNPLNSVAEKMLHDAYELAYLAQSIPQDVEKTNHGLLPKDLTVRLKRIQQLSKELRTGISP